MDFRLPEDDLANSQPQPDQNNFNYYHQYCRVFMANMVLINHLKDLTGTKNQLLGKLTKLEVEDIHDGYSNCEQRKNKRYRRTASQIDRHYKCGVQNCQKSYGSQGSLNQHIKLKHPQIYALMPNMQSVQSKQEYYSQSQ